MQNCQNYHLKKEFLEPILKMKFRMPFFSKEVFVQKFPHDYFEKNRRKENRVEKK